MRYIAMTALALAGLIHLVIGPGHYAHAPAHGIFHTVAGTMEIIWALAFWRRSTQGLYLTGVSLVGGLIVLWAITRLLPAPFEVEPGAVDATGLLSKGAELVGIVALLALARRGRLVGMVTPSARLLAGAALALALTFGWATFGIGLAAVELVPSWGSKAEHGQNGAGGAAPEAEARLVVIQATDTGFQPSTLYLSAGEPVILLLQNMGADEHHLHVRSLNPKDLYWLPRTPKEGEQIDIHNLHHEGKLPYHICNSKFGICPTGLDVHLHANPGDYDLVGFTPTQAGAFKFLCPLPDHEERGMVGVLVVAN